MLCLPGFGTHADSQNLPHFRPFPASIQEHSPPKCLFSMASAKLPNRPRFALLQGGNSLRLLNALNSEDRGLKVGFSLAMIVFETFELILCQMLSSQGKNAPSNPYPHYLVRLATSRFFPKRSLFSDILRPTVGNGMGPRRSRNAEEPWRGGNRRGRKTSQRAPVPPFVCYVFHPLRCFERGQTVKN